MVVSRPNLPSWMSAAASRVDLEGRVSSMNTRMEQSGHHSDANLGFGERALSAGGAAVLSAIIVNPLDVAKTRLQAQAAGVPYRGACQMSCFETNTMMPDMRCSLSGERVQPSLEPICPSSTSRYSGTLDVLFKVIRQEGFGRLWRGTNASLALAVPTVGIYLPCYDIFRNLMEEFTSKKAPSWTPYVPLVAGSVARSLACITCYPIELARTRMQAFEVTQNGNAPGVWKTLVEVINPMKSTSNGHSIPNYRFLWTGLGAQLARDVPFSAICWSTLEPLRRRMLDEVGEGASAPTILGVNFSAGFIAGCLAAAATCPLDVAKTRRQIENDPQRALKMTTRTTLIEILRDGGGKGLFTGVGPRVGRAGPSVGIVVSFYEVVKYAIHKRHLSS